MASLQTDNNNKTIQVLQPATGSQVAYTATAANTSAYSGKTVVRVVSDQACYIAIGVDATANTSTSTYLPAGVVEYFKVADGHRVSAVQVSAGGTLYVTEMA